MLRISLKVLVFAAGLFFLSQSAVKFFKNNVVGNDPIVLFQTSISHPSLLSGERQRTYIKIDLTGFKLEQEAYKTPVNVALVIDKSGSMNGEKMTQAKEAALQAIDRLSSGDMVSIITYANGAEVLLPATEIADKFAIRQKIHGITAGGGTALYAGVVEGANQVREYLSDNHVNRVILLSDGQANQGPDTPFALGQLGAQLIENGISVTTIGLGLGYNEDLMVQLAYRSDGNHHFVEHADLLVDMFNQEFGDVLSVVAQDVNVKIKLKDGIRPIGVMGRNARIDGQEVEVAMNQLYSEQEKYIMLEVETMPEERSGDYEIAQVDLSYANMVTASTDKFSSAVFAHFTQSEAKVEEDLDEGTMVEAVQQQAVLNEEKAIALRDAGRQAEAEAVLEENAAFLDQSAARYDSDKLAKEADDSRAAASSLGATEWNARRKSMRSDHYKTKTQQKN